MANAADIAFRSPKSSIAVLPIFRQDATPIPDYFIDQVMPSLTVGQLKVALAIFKLMKHAGDEEIITDREQLAGITGIQEESLYKIFVFFQKQRIFQINVVHQARIGIVGGKDPSLYQIKFINLVNYSK
jgi:hypothetical protein